jgi:hypothetical protein
MLSSEGKIANRNVHTKQEQRCIFLPFEICPSLSFVAARCFCFSPRCALFILFLNDDENSHKQFIIKSTLGRTRGGREEH